jgi:hypothetical protein
LADLAIKALSHLIPALLAKFGEQAGSVLSNEAIQFARAKGILKEAPMNGAGYTLKAKPKPKPQQKKLKGEEVQYGVLTKKAVSISEYPTTSQFSEFSTLQGIMPVAQSTKKGGSSNLAGGSSNLPGDGIFLAGQDSYVPKRRGRPPKPKMAEAEGGGKKKN